MRQLERIMQDRLSHDEICRNLLTPAQTQWIFYHPTWRRKGIFINCGKRQPRDRARESREEAESWASSWDNHGQEGGDQGRREGWVRWKDEMRREWQWEQAREELAGAACDGARWLWPSEDDHWWPWQSASKIPPKPPRPSGGWGVGNDGVDFN